MVKRTKKPSRSPDSLAKKAVDVMKRIDEARVVDGNLSSADKAEAAAEKCQCPSCVMRRDMTQIVAEEMDNVLGERVSVEAVQAVLLELIQILKERGPMPKTSLEVTYLNFTRRANDVVLDKIHLGQIDKRKCQELIFSIVGLLTHFEQ